MSSPSTLSPRTLLTASPCESRGASNSTHSRDEEAAERKPTPIAIKPRKAYNNKEWMHSRSARHVRIMCEYLEVQDRLNHERILCTVLVFGSARGVSHDQWNKQMDSLVTQKDRLEKELLAISLEKKKSDEVNGGNTPKIPGNTMKDGARKDGEQESRKRQLGEEIKAVLVRINRLEKLKWMCEYWDKVYHLSKKLIEWFQTPEARKAVSRILREIPSPVAMGVADELLNVIEAESEGAMARALSASSLTLSLDEVKMGDERSLQEEVDEEQHNNDQDDGNFSLRRQYESSVDSSNPQPMESSDDDVENSDVPTLMMSSMSSPSFMKRQKKKQLKTLQSSSSGKSVVALCTGGGPGMMEAANKGAFEVPGGRSMGMGISLPFELGLNPYVHPELAFEFHYFFTRKFWMLYSALGLIAAPGGVGTMDELMEVLTLRQSGKFKRRIPVVLLGKEFWKKVINFDSLVEYGTVAESDRDQLFYTDDVDEAFHHIRQCILSDQLCLTDYVHKSKRPKKEVNIDVLLNDEGR